MMVVVVSGVVTCTGGVGGDDRVVVLALVWQW